MLALLDEHKGNGGELNLARLAEVCGLDLERFLAAVDSDAVRLSVEEDAALARRLDVESTPTAFLNGRRVPDLCLDSRMFWTAIAGQLPRVDELALTTADSSSR